MMTTVITIYTKISVL